MAILFSDGLETGNFSAYSETGGTVSVVVTPVHHGSYAAKATGSGSWWLETLPAAYTDLYARMYVLFPAMLSPITYAVIFDVRDEAWTGLTDVAVSVFEEDGAMYFGFTSPTGWEGYYATPIQPNTWYCIEIRRCVGTGNGIAQMWLNGALIFSRQLETITGNNRPVQSGNIWTDDTGFVLFGDCHVISDAYIGPEVAPPPTTPTLTVQSNPELNVPVYIDGVLSGNTPIAIQLPSGTHTVRVDQEVIR